jgi:hypothetical protein
MEKANHKWYEASYRIYLGNTKFRDLSTMDSWEVVVETFENKKYEEEFVAIDDDEAYKIAQDRRRYIQDNGTIDDPNVVFARLYKLQEVRKLPLNQQQEVVRALEERCKKNAGHRIR